MFWEILFFLLFFVCPVFGLNAFWTMNDYTWRKTATRLMYACEWFILGSMALMTPLCAYGCCVS